jgi:hypothetical protein
MTERLSRRGTDGRSGDDAATAVDGVDGVDVAAGAEVHR